MALTQEQVNALVKLLDEPAVSLNELPQVEQIDDQDLFLTRQDTREKAVTGEKLKHYFNGLDKDKNLLDVTDKDIAITNLGLEERLYPVGAPIPWPSVNVPVGYLKCNGAAFDKVQYPKLAQAYPSGILPDLRGEFIRGWDDERGVDVGRAILTAQGDVFKRHEHNVRRRSDDHMITQSSNTNAPGGSYLSLVHSSTLVQNGDTDTPYATPTGDEETRPRNIAFLYIVKAA